MSNDYLELRRAASRAASPKAREAERKTHRKGDG